MSSKITDEFRTTTVTVRGTTYSLKELSAAEYDEILKIASGPNDEADLTAVLKMMTVKSVTDPVMTADELVAKPYTVYAKLLGAVNKLHFAGDDEDASPNS